MADSSQASVDLNVFQKLESDVRSYCRSYPIMFCRSKGSLMYSEQGKEYIDFLSGAGSLNYGHNNDYIKQSIVDYLASDGIIQGLDLHTTAKATFLQTFAERVLEPNDLDYKVQFCGPTGTNAVEAALKLARKATGRLNVFAFMGSYHGLSLGSLALTSDARLRSAGGVPLSYVQFMPYPHSGPLNIDSIAYMDAILSDTHSGTQVPAAIIFESIQCEGGINVAPIEWLKDLRSLCDRHGILLICDDIQVGCGRTGPFFSFTKAGIMPDIVALSKSISGYGLPMSLLLIRRDLDIWSPGEHTGTFRGNQLAFVGATAALEYRESINLAAAVQSKEAFLVNLLHELLITKIDNIEIRGLGLVWGIDFSRRGGSNTTEKIMNCCTERGLILERCGRSKSVIKILPSLTIPEALLEKGCRILAQSVYEAEHSVARSTF